MKQRIIIGYLENSAAVEHKIRLDLIMGVESVLDKGYLSPGLWRGA